MTDRMPTSVADAVRLMKVVSGKSGIEIAAFAKKVFGQKMQIHWEADGNRVSRVLFTPDRCAAELQNYHGLVLDGDMRVVSLGARQLMPRNSVRGLPGSGATADGSDYIVYDAVDGTQVTLYWYDDQWCLSTSNGYDVGHYRWLGEKTYWEAFADCASSVGLDLLTLERDAAYTFIFRDHEFHPLQADPASLWFLCAHDIKAINTGSEPRDLTVPGVRTQERSELATVKARCDGALTACLDALRARVDGSTAPVPFYYGAILRSKSGKNPDYLIESTLIKRVRQFMYTLPYEQKALVAEIPAPDRLTYLILRAHLSPSRAEFLTLFPQYADTMAGYGKAIRLLAEQIVMNLRDRKPAPAVTPSERLAERLAAHLRENTQLNALDAIGPSIVYDFLMQPSHTDLYMLYKLC